MDQRTLVELDRARREARERTLRLVQATLRRTSPGAARFAKQTRPIDADRTVGPGRRKP